jgi:predicted small lipoprotein YifL
MRSLLLSLAAAAFLCACGQKGPLYLPGQKPGENQQQPMKPVPPVPATGSGRR